MDTDYDRRFFSFFSFFSLPHSPRRRVSFGTVPFGPICPLRPARSTAARSFPSVHAVIISFPKGQEF